jgi:hypothetical protein
MILAVVGATAVPVIAAIRGWIASAAREHKPAIS